MPTDWGASSNSSTRSNEAAVILLIGGARGAGFRLGILLTILPLAGFALWYFVPPLLIRWALTPVCSASAAVRLSGGAVALERGELRAGGTRIPFERIAIRGIEIAGLLPGRALLVQRAEIDLPADTRVSRRETGPSERTMGPPGGLHIDRIVVRAPEGAHYSNGILSLTLAGQIDLAGFRFIHGEIHWSNLTGAFQSALLRVQDPPIRVLSGPCTAREIRMERGRIRVDSLDFSRLDFAIWAPSEVSTKAEIPPKASSAFLPITIERLHCASFGLGWHSREGSGDRPLLRLDRGFFSAARLEISNPPAESTAAEVAISARANGQANLNARWEAGTPGRSGILSAESGPFDLLSFKDLLSQVAGWRVDGGRCLGLNLKATLTRREMTGRFDLHWRDLALAQGNGGQLDFIRRHNLAGQAALEGMIEASNAGAKPMPAFAAEAFGREVLRVIRRY